MIHLPAQWGLPLIFASLFGIPIALLIVPPVAERWKHRGRLPWDH